MFVKRCSVLHSPRYLTAFTKFRCNASVRFSHSTEDERKTPMGYLESKLVPELREWKNQMRKNKITRRQIIHKHGGIIKEIAKLRGNDAYLRYFSFFKLEDTEIQQRQFIMNSKKYILGLMLAVCPYKLLVLMLGYQSQSQALQQLILTGLLIWSLVTAWRNSLRFLSVTRSRLSCHAVEEYSLNLRTSSAK